MRNAIIVAAMGLMILAGCKDMHMPWDKKDKATTQASMTDDCPHCAGTQTARSDGTCPMCGMKVKKM